jgi:hypothetical protein
MQEPVREPIVQTPQPRKSDFVEITRDLDCSVGSWQTFRESSAEKSAKIQARRLLFNAALPILVALHRQLQAAKICACRHHVAPTAPFGQITDSRRMATFTADLNANFR